MKQQSPKSPLKHQFTVHDQSHSQWCKACKATPRSLLAQQSLTTTRNDLLYSLVVATTNENVPFFEDDLPINRLDSNEIMACLLALTFLDSFPLVQFPETKIGFASLIYLRAGRSKFCHPCQSWWLVDAVWQPRWWLKTNCKLELATEISTVIPFPMVPRSQVRNLYILVTVWMTGFT